MYRLTWSSWSGVSGAQFRFRSPRWFGWGSCGTTALGAAFLTALASLGVVAHQERLRNRKAGNDLRRAAYAGLILALDRLDEICWPLLAQAAAFAPNPPAEADVLAAAAAVQEAHVAVLLGSSPNARVAPNVGRLAAWEWKTA